MAKDHSGKEYRSERAMLKDYGIGRTNYATRIKNGWSMEKALTTPSEYDSDTKVKDHLGQEYNTKIEMCKAYGIEYDTYLKREKKGMPKEEALTKPVRKRSKVEHVNDHLGKTYSSVRAMEKAYGIPHATYTRRIENGMSVKDALTTPGRKTQDELKVYDHNGAEFESEKKMLKHYKISRSTYINRVNAKMSLEKILTTPPREKSKNHIGEESITTAGQKMKITKYISYNDMTVEFEDGTTREHVKYISFKRGNIENQNLDTGYNRVQIAYRLSDETVALYCKCRKCKKQYIGTWHDIYAHVCDDYHISTETIM